MAAEETVDTQMKVLLQWNALEGAFPPSPLAETREKVVLARQDEASPSSMVHVLAKAGINLDKLEGLDTEALDLKEEEVACLFFVEALMAFREHIYANLNELFKGKKMSDKFVKALEAAKLTPVNLIAAFMSVKHVDLKEGRNILKFLGRAGLNAEKKIGPEKGAAVRAKIMHPDADYRTLKEAETAVAAILVADGGMSDADASSLVRDNAILAEVADLGQVLYILDSLALKQTPTRDAKGKAEVVADLLAAAPQLLDISEVLTQLSGGQLTARSWRNGRVVSTTHSPSDLPGIGHLWDEMMGRLFVMCGRERPGTEEVHAKHQLERTWTMWLDVPSQNNNSKNWLDSVQKVYTFSTVEDFWRLMANIPKPTDLAPSSNYHLFIDGVKPLWEDPVNKNGGKWVASAPKAVTNDFWLDTLLAVIGETLPCSEEVTGLVCSLRKQNRLALWTRDWQKKEANLDIGRAFKATLKSEGKLTYQNHNDALKNNRSFNNKAKYEV